MLRYRSGGVPVMPEERVARALEVFRRWVARVEPGGFAPAPSSRWPSMVVTCLDIAATTANDAELGAITRALLAELDRMGESGERL